MVLTALEWSLCSTIPKGEQGIRLTLVSFILFIEHLRINNCVIIDWVLKEHPHEKRVYESYVPDEEQQVTEAILTPKLRASSHQFSDKKDDDPHLLLDLSATGEADNLLTRVADLLA